MKFTPNSTARRNTLTAAAGSCGSPHLPGPVSWIAPKPRRLTVSSPPMLNVVERAAHSATDIRISSSHNAGLAPPNVTPPAFDEASYPATPPPQEHPHPGTSRSPPLVTTLWHTPHESSNEPAATSSGSSTAGRPPTTSSTRAPAHHRTALNPPPRIVRQQAPPDASRSMTRPSKPTTNQHPDPRQSPRIAQQAPDRPGQSPPPPRFL